MTSIDDLFRYAEADAFDNPFEDLEGEFYAIVPMADEELDELGR